MTTPLSVAAPRSDLWRGVEVLVDVDDTAECVAALGARHDLGHGVAVCHLTPGPAGLSVLGEDVLVALGKRPSGPAAEGVSRRAWELAGLWLRAEQVRHLVVLRAQLLPTTRWRELAELTAAAGTRLWLVTNEPGRDTAERGRPWRVALSLLPTPATAVTGKFPEVPDVEFPLFRTAARRLLDPAGFARVDEVYRTTLAQAHDVARGWARPGTAGRPVDARHGAAVLQRHTIDATSTAEVLTRVRAVQAGFFTAGLFLQLPPRPGLSAVRVSLTPRLDPTDIDRIRGLCSPSAAAVLAIAAATGLRAGALQSVRLREVHDTGPDQHLVADGTLYRLPTSVAGLVRAAVIERHAQLAGEPAPGPGLGEGALFIGSSSETSVTRRALQQALDRAAAYAGVTVAPPSFPGVAVHDLRGTR
ncbi:hypothetical protein I4I73_04800 [Pseudonocardia sp. KRD-184]|jgi:integrase|uniref:Tyr recombinase domain-containing protein n=1 Tax=Pseudonocardia oceani TaxID=2792013 RepID=A0ABS6UJT7_9PSEU|nr:hypothetical protein [Pseudonocardia oceani]MBW0093821.1 hypothetical protein [Pseudonocardia oceani]MBW0095318.1 hypothetical protein [Pseudonocardia oceani]MBW0111698.1 hypothetical protein [Pseudonocardia oceani]MBW0120040.1 hypothetical protein [Pseudonocardia oceani]MBW0132496.1 hypothetical protein [Pseudonocardia oceani]